MNSGKCRELCDHHHNQIKMQNTCHHFMLPLWSAPPRGPTSTHPALFSDPMLSPGPVPEGETAGEWAASLRGHDHSLTRTRATFSIQTTSRGLSMRNKAPSSQLPLLSQWRACQVGSWRRGDSPRELWAGECGICMLPWLYLPQGLSEDSWP